MTKVTKLACGRGVPETDEPISPVGEPESAQATAAAVHGDYGRCPRCRAFGVERERRLGGNDKCQNGHVYPSSDAVPAQPEQITADTDKPRSSSDLAKGMDVLGNLAAKDKRIAELENLIRKAEQAKKLGDEIDLLEKLPFEGFKDAPYTLRYEIFDLGKASAIKSRVTALECLLSSESPAPTSE